MGKVIPLHRRRVNGKLVLGFFLLLVILLFIFGRWQLVRHGGLFIKTTISRHGVMELGFQVEALAVRREQTFYAPIPGRISLLVPAGQRVQGGSVIVEIWDEGQLQGASARLEESRAQWRDGELAALEHIYQLDKEIKALEAQGKGSQKLEDLKACREALLSQTEREISAWESSVGHITIPTAGVIHYELDGLEGVLTPEGVLSYSKEELVKLTPQRIKRTDGQEVAAGDPLFRLLPDHQLYLLTFIPPVDEPVRRGQRVEVHIPGFPELAARVEGLGQPGEEQALLLALDRYLPAFDTLRQLPVKIIIQRHRGTILPASAVRESRGRIGVYIQTPEGPLFQPVKVLGRQGEEVCVGGVPEGVPVIVRGLWLQV
ncbi:MAG: HlyD family efflux transporter periplasmic adaptor subunit [Limnochordia bacterium]|jgi:putative membrane fusion protein